MRQAPHYYDFLMGVIGTRTIIWRYVSRLWCVQ